MTYGATEHNIRCKMVPTFLGEGRYVLDPNGVNANLSVSDKAMWLNRAMANEVISLLDFIDLGVSEIQISHNLGSSITTAYPMAGIMRNRVKDALNILRDGDHSVLFQAANTMAAIRTETLAWV